MTRIIQSNDQTNKVLNLETHIKRLALERQTFFNMKFELEKQIAERDELLSEKEIQIDMIKGQISILIREIEQLKKLQASSQPLSLMTPSNIVKKIRGGSHHNGFLGATTPINTEYSDTATTETNRMSGRKGSKHLGGLRSPPPVTLFTNRSNPSSRPLTRNDVLRLQRSLQRDREGSCAGFCFETAGRIETGPDSREAGVCRCGARPGRVQKKEPV